MIKKHPVLILLFSLLFLHVSADFAGAPIQAQQTLHLIPVGQTVALHLIPDGLFCLDYADISPCPARDAGLMPGDRIIKAEQTPVTSALLFSSVLDAHPNKTRLTVRRGSAECIVEVTPLFRDGHACIGMWVREELGGIGTVTYCHPETHAFAALGHSVSDPAASLLFPIKGGFLYPATVVSVKKGVPNTAGEIMAIRDTQTDHIGTLTKNTNFGVFGKLSAPITSPAYPIGLYDSLTRGKAQILSDIEGTVTAYSIEIEQILTKNPRSNKNFVIHVTDPRLLEKTGGIVRGLSGAPILQNGRLVGAVTHVLTRDPTRGYGICIENMLRAAEDPL